MLRKTPWFTAAAVLILALAIGANLAVFGVVDALMFRSIPVSRPEELVRIDTLGRDGQLSGMPSTVLDPLRKDPAFSGVCGFMTPRVTTRMNEVTASTGSLAMTGDCFRTLGVGTQLGRPFNFDDDRPEAPNVVVLTANLWRRAFGASLSVLGKQIQAGAETYTIIGVATDDFTGVLLGFQPGLLIPLHHTPSELPQRRFAYYWVSIFARRAPGISEQAAAARIATTTTALLEESVPARYNQAQRRNYLSNRLVVSSARTGVDWMLRNRFGKPLYALLGICAAILLVGCLNLASLLTARTLARSRELGIRFALGASGWRVIRPLALESLLLTLTGAAAGVVFSAWASSAIVAEASAIFSNFSIDASLGARGFVLLAGVIGWVALVLTVAPLWQARRAGDVREAGRGIIGSSARAQKTLIGIQVAFTLALVSASVVFASSFASLKGLPLGLHPEGVAEAMLSPAPGGYRLENPGPYYANLLQRVGELPGVAAASLSSYALYWHKLYPEPIRSGDGGREVRAQTIRISDGYFRTLGVRLRAGEDFSRERADAEAIVSESVNTLLGGNLSGGYILVGDTAAAQRYRVAGIAPNMRISMEDPRNAAPPVVYLNFWQEPKQQRYPVLLVKSAAGRRPDIKAVAAAVDSLGKEYLEQFVTLEAARSEAIIEDRLLAYLASAFGALALVLAAVGLFAILSLWVGRKTSEIGLRMALGAGRSQIRALVLRQIAVVLLAGIAAGLALSLGLGQVLESIAYGLPPGNPALLACAVVLLLLTALAAALVPARRAASIEPLAALRQE